MTDNSKQLQELSNSIASAYENVCASAKVLVTEFLCDTSIDIDTRWLAFTQIANILPCKPFGDGNIELINSSLSLYDDFYINRWQTCSYTEMYATIKEKVDDIQRINVWREAVMRSGYGSFMHDW